MSKQRSHLIRKVHRYLSYILGVQVVLWLMGGVVFAWLPFDSVIKGGAARQTPADAPLPSNWQESISRVGANVSEISTLRSAASAQGTLLLYTADDVPHWLRLQDGEFDTEPTAKQVQEFARVMYAGSAAIGPAVRIAEPDAQVFGLVRELYGRRDVWQVTIDDWLNTRFYFDGPTGLYFTVRNDAWVLYDTFWRLHIMDYGGGEDFNNMLLSVFSVSALLFALSGIALGTQRLLRRRQS